LSFEEKQACYDKVSGSNHLASPHIEGFDTHRTDADKPLSSCESALGKHRKNKNSLEIIPPISGSILAVYLKNSWNNAI